MCDDEIHQGVITEVKLSRRGFGLAGVAVAGLAGEARAAAVVERDVDVRTPDGTADAALFYPQGRGSWPAVLIWPDVVSLRPVFRQMGQRLAAEGYVVLVPNLYYRVKRAPVVEPGFNFGDPAQREKITPMRATVTPEGTMRDAKAYLAFLDAQRQTARRKKAGVQGYCMGGPLAFRTAAAVPDRIGAVASFHGGGLTADEADSPHRLVPRTRAEYLVLIADNDDARDPKSKETLKAALDAAGRPSKVEVYKDSPHGWTVPGGQSYRPGTAERAWAELLSLYQRALT